MDDHSDFAPSAALSANTRESMEVLGGARHKVESTLPVFWGNCHGRRPCRGERDSERTREKTHAFSRMSTSATQCAATLQGKRPLQKGTDVYQEQENF